MIMLDALTLDQIRLFLAVAETGSFSKAAKQLNRATYRLIIARLTKLAWLRVKFSQSFVSRQQRPNLP